MACDTIIEGRLRDSGMVFSTPVAVVCCRTHSVTIEGTGGVRDNLCVIGRIERLEARMSQVIKECSDDV